MECTICLSSFIDPRILRCGHTFCKACLYPLLSNSKIVCPYCCQTQENIFNIEDLIKNFSIAQDSVQDNVVQNDVCPEHESPIRFYCISCAESGCMECILCNHRDTNKHKTTDYEEQEKSLRSILELVDQDFRKFQQAKDRLKNFLQASSQFEILTKSNQIIEELGLADYKARISQVKKPSVMTSQIRGTQPSGKSQLSPDIFHPNQPQHHQTLTRPISSKGKQGTQAQYQQNVYHTIPTKAEQPKQNQQNPYNSASVKGKNPIQAQYQQNLNSSTFFKPKQQMQSQYQENPTKSMSTQSMQAQHQESSNKSVTPKGEQTDFANAPQHEYWRCEICSFEKNNMLASICSLCDSNRPVSYNSKKNPMKEGNFEQIPKFTNPIMNNGAAGMISGASNRGAVGERNLKSTFQKGTGIAQSNISYPSPSNRSTPETELEREAQRKSVIGERLYALISRIQPKIAGKLTGMLLDLNNAELMNLIANPDALNDRVNEAVQALEMHNGDFGNFRH